MIFILIPILLWSLAPFFGNSLETSNIFIKLNYIFFFAFIFFSSFTIYNIKVKKIKYNLNKINYKFSIFIALIVINVFIYQGAYYYGVAEYNPVEINTINYLWAVFIPFISIFLLKKKQEISSYDIFLLFLSFFAITFITNIYENFQNFNLGHLMMIIGAFCTALNTVIALKIKEDFKDINIEITYLFFTGILSIILFTYNSIIDINELLLSNSDYFYLFILGFIVLGSTRPIWYYILDNYDKTKAMVFSFLTPALGNLWLILFKGTIITNSTIIGFILIMISMILNNEKVKRFIYRKIKVIFYNN